jgi:hypothetical protein
MLCMIQDIMTRYLRSMICGVTVYDDLDAVVLLLCAHTVGVVVTVHVHACCA